LAIYAFTQSVTLPAAAGGGSGAGKPTSSAIGVELDTGVATPQLYAAIASGAVLPRVSIQLSSLERSGLGTESFKVILSDVSLTLTEVTRKPLDKSLMSLSLLFAQIAWEYTPRNDMGGPAAVIPGSWDVRSGVGQGTRPDRVRYVVSDEPDIAGADEIVANQFKHSISRASSTSGAGAGKAIANVAALQGPVDRNVVSHFVALVTGAHLPDARVRVLNPSVDELRYDFEDVQVRSLSLAAAADGTLEEAMSFDYQRIRWTSGSESQGWDFARNRRW
jgi:type VI protein secretion system component Hcp